MKTFDEIKTQTHFSGLFKQNSQIHVCVKYLNFVRSSICPGSQATQFQLTKTCRVSRESYN